MRILKVMLAGSIVLGLAGGAAAQSLGQLADKEKQKRQGKPAPKVITESDLSRAGKNGTLSMAGSPAGDAPADDGTAAPDGSATAEAEPGAEASPEGTEPPADAAAPEKAPEPVKPKGPPQKTEEEIRSEARANLQKSLDTAKTNLANHQRALSQIEGVLNASAGDYSQSRADLFKRQDEEKAAVTKYQDEVAKLEEDVRRGAWPR